KDAPEKTDPSAVTPPAAQMAQAEPPLMPDAAFRAKPPPPLAQQPHFDPPVPLQRKLKNGARVLIVEHRSLPLVAIEVRFLYGGAPPPARPRGPAARGARASATPPRGRPRAAGLGVAGARRRPEGRVLREGRDGGRARGGGPPHRALPVLSRGAA